MSWEEDYKLGIKFEDFLIELFRKNGEAVRVADRTKPMPYDFIIPRMGRFECKFDRMSQSTGKVAIEGNYKGKPSGLTTTKAEFWLIGFYLDGWNVASIRPTELKKLCLKQNEQMYSNRSAFMLLNVKTLKDKCFNLNFGQSRDIQSDFFDKLDKILD